MDGNRKLDYSEIWARLQAGQRNMDIADSLGYNRSSVNRAIVEMRKRKGPQVVEIKRRCKAGTVTKLSERCDPNAYSECDGCAARWMCDLRVKVFVGPTMCEYRTGRAEWVEF